MRIQALLAMAFVLLLSTSAQATWVTLNNDPTRTDYFDPDTIVRESGITTIWILIDYVNPKREVDDVYLSSKGQWQVNCANRTARQAYHIIYPGHMGAGESLWSGYLNKQYQPIVPGTIGELIFEQACK